MCHSQHLFKYYPQDFGKLTVKVQHMDLFFDIFEKHTDVLSHFKAQTLDAPITQLELNAKNLEIHDVKCSIQSITYDYKKEQHKLLIYFGAAIPAHTEFVITTKTTCTPTKHILEGLYYDETPAGAPPTMITQCQQWGFQRIVPCIDDMTAKCTYTTTIIADRRYTNIITNGDIAVPRQPTGNGRDKIVYHNTTTPMAPYLFFLGVGTYATFYREFEYPNGHTFMLELLVPPKSDEKIAHHALEILHDAIMWIHLFTGPDRYKNQRIGHEILSLIQEREQRKKEGKSVEEIRNKLKSLSGAVTFGYQYTGTVYREIGMQNSDFGGMENVGNTTITTNRIMPFPQMTDGSFEYMIRVKCHEFYHNLNGSEVTGQSPFEIWLNEAVTVHIEREYHAFLFGSAYARLSEVLGLLSPDGGTFLADESVASMPVEPDGFNDPNELITSVTYVKAPEFVNMIERFMGKEQFVKALDLYHRRYKHSNASRAQWIGCMEEVAGMDFTKMAECWLKKTGFPHVSVFGEFDPQAKKYDVCFEQINATDSWYWEFPCTCSLFYPDGSHTPEKTVHISSKKQMLEFSNLSQEPAFISLGRWYSFYGKIHYQPTREQLFLQVRSDTDIINSYMAFYFLMDGEKIRLLKNPAEQVRDDIIDMYYGLLTNRALTAELGGTMLALFESVKEPTFAHKYQELYEVKKKIMQAIASKYHQQILELYAEYSAEIPQRTYMKTQVHNIKRRQIKNICLGLLAALDTTPVHALIKKQYQSAKCATDKLIAFRLYLNSSAPDKMQVLDDFEEIAKKNLVSWEAFLSVVGSNDSEQWLSLIGRVEQSAAFRIEQANDQRALYGMFAHNKKKSLLTDEGRAFLRDTIIRLAQINEYSTLALVRVLGNIDKADQSHHVPLVQMLLDIVAALDAAETPSVYNTARRILAGLTGAKETYERAVGKITV